ncbi:hypothetical protein [Kordiimonas marina]|uniref:hypothetical protein n=1 Tax=Kordiimonas marina TaxID=2872312 RepID=UPI001FF24FDE|nr:hypothetical protein [Kordiimonas marina]MCJ9429816.1 hypothetical protein [Kordiimonas marina]
MSLASRLILICLTLGLAGCNPVAKAPASPEAIVGTRALIKGYGQEMTAEIREVKGKLVTTEFQWQGGETAIRSYYRGLYAVSGRGKGYHWEADFDEAKLEPLFPLTVGKEVSFSGTSRDIDRGTSADFWTNLSVVDQKTIELPTGARKVFVVDIVTEYHKGNVVKRKTNTVYFDPKLSMVLKSVVHDGNYQRFWRVVSIDVPGDGKARPSPTQQRRAGTVMI